MPAVGTPQTSLQATDPMAQQTQHRQGLPAPSHKEKIILTGLVTMRTRHGNRL